MRYLLQVWTMRVPLVTLMVVAAAASTDNECSDWKGKCDLHKATCLVESRCLKENERDNVINVEIKT
ncbi:hypothetical protein BIW11_11532, partial [Tropilaelaps mercedesae]